MPITTDHVHTYRRILKRPEYYRCVHPDCTHYMHRMYLPGKRTLCNKCQQPFILDWRALQLSKPHCDNCTKKRKKGINVVETLQKLLGA